MLPLKQKRILVTGGGGFLGQHVLAALEARGVPDDRILTLRSKDVDLRDRSQSMDAFRELRPDVVVGLAARLGGIGDNRRYPASYFYDNLMIGVNTIEASRQIGVEKLVLVGTVCSYPKVVPYPFKEADLWNGFPEETNAPYGVSKKAVGLYAEAVKEQYGLNAVNLLMTNLYGPGDDFREATSHVIPAIIRKVHEAKLNGDAFITAWGDGSPSRDFLYVKDAAEGIVQACEGHNDPAPVNLGSGREITIRDLILQICSALDFQGEVRWDTSKPNGQPRRVLDIEKARQAFGFNPAMSFEEGLNETVQWYLRHKEALHALGAKYEQA